MNNAESKGTETDKLWDKVCNIDSNIKYATNEFMGYVCPELYLDRLKYTKKVWLMNRKANETDLRNALLSGYNFSGYKRTIIRETKEREINYHSSVSDNIAELAVLRVVEPYIRKTLSASSFGSIKGRGLTLGAKRLESLVRKYPDAYYVQTDCAKYYRSIDHEILKAMLPDVIPSARCVSFLCMLIDSYSPGIPIGIPTGHYFGNLMLSPVDKWLEKDVGVFGFVRNMDDIVAVIRDKSTAHHILDGIKRICGSLHLTIKNNARISPVSRGVDALGYVFYPTHTRIRRRIKDNMRRKARLLEKRGVSDLKYKQSMASHYGWCLTADARHLLQTIMGEKLKLFNKMKIQRRSELKPKRKFFGLDKDKFVSITELDGKEVLILEVQTVTIKGEDKTAIRMCLTSETGDDPSDARLLECNRYTITKSTVIADRLNHDADIIPFAATFHKVNNRYYSYD